MHSTEVHDPEPVEVPHEPPSAEVVLQLKTALARIGAHIGKPAKFSKASALLRKLLDESKLVPEVGDSTFQVRVLPLS